MENNSAVKIIGSDADTQMLIKQACAGDRDARTYINSVAAPYIEFHSDRFCRRFCQYSYRNARCTLSPPQGPSPSDSALCDKANASYAWMLDELTNNNRLRKIEAKSEAQLASYFKAMAISLPFYERWKNWRFERRVHVPQYICDINEQAKVVFLNLRSESNFALIAQKIGASENLVRETADKIIIELSQRKRLHLLNPPSTQSLSLPENSDSDGESNGVQQEIEDSKFSPETLLQADELKQAWSQLDDVEQFVVEALVIEQQDANIVLHALAENNVPLGKNTHADQNDRQQLYYFKRKTLEKLEKLLKSEN